MCDGTRSYEGGREGGGGGGTCICQLQWDVAAVYRAAMNCPIKAFNNANRSALDHLKRGVGANLGVSVNAEPYGMIH